MWTNLEDIIKIKYTITKYFVLPLTVHEVVGEVKFTRQKTEC